MKERQPCETLPAWLKANLGPQALAPLTGTDYKALAAAVQLVKLYGFCDSQNEAGVLMAFRETVKCIQPKNWHLAYHAIAHVMDWHNRSEVWFKAGLPVIPVGRCKHDSTPLSKAEEAP